MLELHQISEFVSFVASNPCLLINFVEMLLDNKTPCPSCDLKHSLDNKQAYNKMLRFTRGGFPSFYHNVPDYISLGHEIGTSDLHTSRLG